MASVSTDDVAVIDRSLDRANAQRSSRSSCRQHHTAAAPSIRPAPQITPPLGGSPALPPARNNTTTTTSSQHFPPQHHEHHHHAFGLPSPIGLLQSQPIGKQSSHSAAGPESPPPQTTTPTTTTTLLWTRTAFAPTPASITPTSAPSASPPHLCPTPTQPPDECPHSVDDGNRSIKRSVVSNPVDRRQAKDGDCVASRQITPTTALTVQSISFPSYFPGAKAGPQTTVFGTNCPKEPEPAASCECPSEATPTALVGGVPKRPREVPNVEEITTLLLSCHASDKPDEVDLAAELLATLEVPGKRPKTESHHADSTTISMAPKKVPSTDHDQLTKVEPKKISLNDRDQLTNDFVEEPSKDDEDELSFLVTRCDIDASSNSNMFMPYIA